jgi:hypothetical protein
MSGTEKDTRSEQKIVIFGKRKELVSQEVVPRALGGTMDQFLRDLLQIPKGKGITVSAGEVGLSLGALKARINRLKRKGRLPKSYSAKRRRVDGEEILYIVNYENTEE